MIRDAKEKDIPRILELLKQVLQIHADIRPDIFIPGTTKYTIDELREILKNKETPIYVAVNEADVCVGYAFCQLREQPFSNNMVPFKSLFIDDLCIDQEARGQHIGESLFEYVKNEAKQLGCYEVTLNVWTGNTSAEKFLLAGELYDCGDAELLTQWHKAKDLVRDYNQMNSADADEKERILNELLGGKGKNLWITAPFYVDYGNNIYFGNNCEVNMNCTFLDDNIIRIGDNALIAPNVQIYTAFHPTNAIDRFGIPKEDGSFEFCKTQTAPVIIGNNVWIGGGAIILPGVTIGNNVVIGAGSVVTKNIPDNVIAAGSPCRVIRRNQ